MILSAYRSAFAEHSKTFSLLSISFVCLISALPINAIEAPTNTPNESEKNIEDTIIVTGSKLHNTTELLPLNAQVISAADIKNSTASDLSQVLSQQAGINMRSLFGPNNSSNTVDLGGFGAAATSNTLFLLDGQRLNDIDLSSVDLSNIPLEFIERIEILPGSGSILYGNGASGGAINIVTKAKFDKRLQISGTTTPEPGSNNINVTVAGNTDKSSSILSVSRREQTGFRENNDLSQKNIFTSQELYLNESSLLFLTASADELETGLPGARRVNLNTSLNEIEDDPRGTSMPNDFSKRKGSRIHTGYKYQTANKEINLSIGARNKNQRFLSDFGSGFTAYGDTDLDSFSFTPYIRETTELKYATTTSTLGIDMFSSNYESFRSLNEQTVSQPIHKVNISQELKALYFQNITNINETVALTLGARKERVNTDAKDNFDINAPGASPFDGQGAPFNITQQKSLYSIGLKYFITDFASVYVRRETSSRFGNIDEIFELDPSTFVSSLDPLEVQTGATNEIGFSINRSNFKFDFSYYLANFKNEIHYDIDETNFLSQNVNLDDTQRSGTKLSLEFKPIKSLLVSANSSYTKAEFVEGIYLGNTLPLVPRQEHNLSMLFSFAENMSFSTNTQYVGRKYFDNDQLNTFQQIDSYHVSDIKLAYNDNTFKTAITVYNFLNNRDIIDFGVKSTFTPGVFNGYTQAGRIVELSAAYSY